jgi:hypothetical protein
MSRLGDVRSRAVTMGKIADILQARGQLDEALKIHNEEQLPVQARGQLDEALKIRNEEELPVYERMGDVRERAVTMAWIANIFRDRGDLDGAVRALCEEVLPVFQRLSDAQELMRGRCQLAGILFRRASEGDWDQARTLLQLARNDARQMALPEAQQIEEIMRQAGIEIPLLEPDL